MSTTATVDQSTLDALTEATPASRDRTVDLIRAVAIGVVVAWHWIFSITHWTDDGRLTMPNFIGDVPGLWAATWILQIMPLFFVVGGYANLAGYDGVRRNGGGAGAFLGGRLRRLVRPIMPFLGVWALIELLRPAIAPIIDLPSVLHWGMVVFVPLWFLGAYGLIILLSPITMALHRRRPVGSLIGLAAAVVAADALRFGAGLEVLGYLNSVLVWVFAHQVGFWWRDHGADVSRRVLTGIAAAAVAALVLMVTVGPYPGSMVATRGGSLSNMFPTTIGIAVLAVLQTAVVLLARPRLSAWLETPSHWKPVVAINAVALTIFTWHMTAAAIVIGLWSLVGGTLRSEADLAWWAQRPLWLVAPALVLAGLVAVFARIERPELARRSP